MEEEEEIETSEQPISIYKLPLVHGGNNLSLEDKVCTTLETDINLMFLVLRIMMDPRFKPGDQMVLVLKDGASSMLTHSKREQQDLEDHNIELTIDGAESTDFTSTDHSRLLLK